MTARWVLSGPDAGGWRSILMDGAQVMREITETERQGLGATLRVIEVGGAEVPVPAPVLPESGAFVSDLMQTNPEDRLPGWARVQIAGFLSTRQYWDGVVLIAGEDASHWVQVSADEVVSFQGFLTGRLNRALGGSHAPDDETMAAVLSRPERLAAVLRRAEVTGDPSVTTGALIGAEIAAAKPYWLGQAVGVIDDDDAYATALLAQGMTPERDRRDSALHAGLSQVAVRFGLD